MEPLGRDVLVHILEDEEASEQSSPTLVKEGVTSYSLDLVYMNSGYSDKHL